MRKMPAGVISAMLVTLCVGLAFFMRVYFPWDAVFGGPVVKLTSIDAYFHMRIIDNLIQNFPHRMQFDPYAIYPGGGMVSTPPFFYWLVSGVAWLVGLGSPSQHTIDVVGVLSPAVLGALIVIPVYIIGKTVFGRWAGIISAGLIAVLPGEFLGRSIMGFTDYHVAEVLFTTLLMMFLILAVRAARERGLSLAQIRRREWAVCGKPVLYSLLAGVFMAIYLYTWAGALLFVFIITLYFIVQFIIDHVRRQSTDYLFCVGTILFLVTLLLFLPSSPSPFFITALVVALLVPALLRLASAGMESREKLHPGWYPVFLVVIGLIGIAVLYLISPSRLAAMFNSFKIFLPVSGAELATMEMQPSLFPGGSFTFALAWGNFTVCYFLAIISLLGLIYLAVRQNAADRNALIVWSLVIFMAAFGQRRFNYYFAVNVALLSGYFCWQFINTVALVSDWLCEKIDLKNLRGQIIRSLGAVTPDDEGMPEPGGKTRFMKRIFTGLAIIIVLTFAFIPNFAKGMNVARASFYPSDAWVESLIWLRENSPDPFANPDAYYQLYSEPPEGEIADYGSGISAWWDYGPPEQLMVAYPESAYAVTSWWDYGYWITRIARRLPSDSPGLYQGRAEVAGLLLSQDEGSAREIAAELDTAYLVIDDMTTTSKYHALISWAEREQGEFYETFYLPEGNTLTPINLHYPGYYRSLCVRLYNFDGQAVAPALALVVSYEEHVVRGDTYKIINKIVPFESYAEAMEHALEEGLENYAITGGSPFVSPIALDAVSDYKLVYSSTDSYNVESVGDVSEVKIFERVRD